MNSLTLGSRYQPLMRSVVSQRSASVQYPRFGTGSTPQVIRMKSDPPSSWTPFVDPEILSLIKKYARTESDKQKDSLIYAREFNSHLIPDAYTHPLNSKVMGSGSEAISLYLADRNVAFKIYEAKRPDRIRDPRGPFDCPLYERGEVVLNGRFIAEYSIQPSVLPQTQKTPAVVDFEKELNRLGYHFTENPLGSIGWIGERGPDGKYIKEKGQTKLVRLVVFDYDCIEKTTEDNPERRFFY